MLRDGGQASVQFQAGGIFTAKGAKNTENGRRGLNQETGNRGHKMLDIKYVRYYIVMCIKAATINERGGGRSFQPRPGERPEN